MPHEAQPAIISVYQTHWLLKTPSGDYETRNFSEKILFYEHASNTAYVDHKLSHWSNIGKSIWFTTQQIRRFPKWLKRNSTCEGNAIERSSKLLHESSESETNDRSALSDSLSQSQMTALLLLQAAFCPNRRLCQLQVSHTFTSQRMQQILLLDSPVWMT